MEVKEYDSRVISDHNRQTVKDTGDNHSSTGDNSHLCNALLSPEIELKCGCKLPVIADSCVREGFSRMPVVSGLYNGKQVNVLRDTGCSTVVIRWSLVSEDQLTGQKIICVLIDGTVRCTPVAEINIQTPYLSGKVKAVCMVKVKGKVFPYSLPSVGPGADPGVQAVSPQVTWRESRHRP